MTEKTINNVATGLILAGAALVLPTALKHAKESITGEGLPVDALRHIPELLSGDKEEKDEKQEQPEQSQDEKPGEQQPQKLYDEHGKEISISDLLKQHQN